MDQQKAVKFICAMRKQQGLTQEQLGQRLGVTNKTVSRWETGKYMPDIDKLQELSEVFGVSIHELLAGERMEDVDSFRKKADEQLVQILTKDSAFGLQDRIAYFKNKWLREHVGLIVLWLVVWAALCEAAIFWKQSILAVLLPVAGLVIYGYVRNQMMIYVEDRAFIPDTKEPQQH